MAKIDFSQKLMNRNGTVMQDGSSSQDDKDFTLRDIVCNSLFSEPLPQANGKPTILSTSDKVKRMRMAAKIDCSPDPIELTAKDVTFLQEALNVYPTISCGQAALMLDGKTFEDLKNEFRPSESKSEPESEIPEEV